METVQQIKKQKWVQQTAKGKYKSIFPIEELKKKMLPVPQSLKLLLQQSLSKLNLEAKHILECLVVYGSSINIKKLALCTEKKEEHLEINILRLEPDWISIENGLIIGRQSLFLPLYALLSKERKVAWHQRIASVLVKYNRRNVTDNRASDSRVRGSSMSVI